MSKTQIELVYFLVAGAILLSNSPLLAQQEQMPGVTIEAKRFADLPPSAEQDQPIPFDFESIKEHDSIHGVCVGPDGEVVANATVQVYRVTFGAGANVEELVESGVSGADGSFSFEGLQSRLPTSKLDSYFVLMVRKEGLATYFSQSILWGEGKQEIKLGRRAVVKGVIRNDLGEPVSNARVNFGSLLDQSLPDIFSTRTDADGKFKIGDYGVLNSRAYKTNDGQMRGSMAVPLWVTHPDYGRVGLMVERTPNFFKIAISRGAKFSGRIVDEQGNAVANVSLGIQSHNQPRTSGSRAQIGRRFESDENGHFQIVKIPNIPVNLTFKHEGLVGRSIVLNGDAGSEKQLGDLTLLTPIKIRGVLIEDSTGEPPVLEKGQINNIGWHGPERPSTSSGVSITKIEKDGTFVCEFLTGKSFPYVQSAEWEMVGNPYKEGIEITSDSTVELKFRVGRRAGR